MKINKEQTKTVSVKIMPIIGEAINLQGFTNNSQYHTVTLLTNQNTEILLKAEDWSEYLQIIQQTRQILKKQKGEGY